MRQPINLLFGLVCILAACTAPVASLDSPTPTATHTLAPAPSWTPASEGNTPTFTVSPTEVVTTTPLPPLPSPTLENQVCSPLAGYMLSELPGIVSNPYHPPAPGSDDPHQGVDLADRLDGSGMAVTGMPVQAILAGKVVLAQADRFPYGFAVIVESELPALPEKVRAWFPTAAPLWTANPALNCPDVPLPGGESTERSAYILYAHLLDTPLVQVGETVACGQVIGAVGQSGNALAPHLHLEIRIGPSGWNPGSLAHYTNDARPEEMGQYCTWRVSGIFQHLDPLEWLAEFPIP